MYKSKLQELCQRKGWELPDYVVRKQGEDHNPHFHATVTVNGTLFQSPATSNTTSKKAQNEAAKLAYQHFSSSPSPSLSPSGATGSSTVKIAGVNSCLSPGEKLQPNTQVTNQTPQLNEDTAVVVDYESFEELQHMYKWQLQTYAQKRNLSLPVYSCERVGPPHASRFKSKVTISGETYDSQEYFPSMSKAENAAAKAAFLSLFPGSEQDETGYKNLLQELAQKEGRTLPIYNTDKSGEAHYPTFVSTVAIEGEIFMGQGAKNKKQAEMSAAKVAYTALKQRNASQSPTVPSPFCQVQEAPQNPTRLSPSHQGNEVPQFSSSSLRADLTAYLQQNVQPKLPVLNAQAVKDAGLDSVSAVKSLPSSYSEDISSSSLPKHVLAASPLPCDSSTSMATTSKNIEDLAGKSTSGRSSRVIVHPRGTAVTYLPGSVMLPFSDDKWVAVKIPAGTNGEKV